MIRHWIRLTTSRHFALPNQPCPAIHGNEAAAAHQYYFARTNFLRHYNNVLLNLPAQSDSRMPSIFRCKDRIYITLTRMRHKLDQKQLTAERGDRCG